MLSYVRLTCRSYQNYCMLYQLLLVSCLLMIEIDTMHWVGRQ